MYLPQPCLGYGWECGEGGGFVNGFTFFSSDFSRVVVLPDHSVTQLDVGYFSIAIHKITFRKFLVFKCSLLHELPVRIDWQQWDMQEKSL